MNTKFKGIILGAGALSAGIFTTLSCSCGASATEGFVKLSDNPNTESSLHVTQHISNAIGHATGTITYKLEECGPILDRSPRETITHTLNFDETVPVGSDSLDLNFDISMADYEFGATGTYGFWLTQETIVAGQTITHDTTQYKIFVDVFNEITEEGHYTGQKVASLVAQALNETTNEKSDIEFNSDYVLTYATVSHNVSGLKADTEHYFKYNVTIRATDDLPQGTRIPIIGLDPVAKKGANQEDYNNPTYVTVNNAGADIYMKHGTNIKVGQDADGRNWIPVGTNLIIEVHKVSALGEIENAYETHIDNRIFTRSQELIQKTLAAMPAADASEEVLASFLTTNDFSFVRVMKENTVSTGIETMIFPFLILAVAGGVGVVFVHKSTKTEKRAER